MVERSSDTPIENDLVPQRLDGVAHVELGLAQLALLFAEILQVAGGQQLLVRQHDDAQLLPGLCFLVMAADAVSLATVRKQRPPLAVAVP